MSGVAQLSKNNRMLRMDVSGSPLSELQLLMSLFHSWSRLLLKEAPRLRHAIRLMRLAADF